MITMLRGMRYGSGSSRKRHNDGGGPSRDTATSREREGSGQALRREPDDGSEVAQEVDHGRCPNGAEGTPLNRADAGGGSHHRGIPAPYAAAALAATILVLKIRGERRGTGAGPAGQRAAAGPELTAPRSS